ncbi:MAG: class I mannose-6-phosphate isomerase [Lachnospiraceae bacterium]|nr:class I mannose-6-phosphate isomerase [Lachnospiraceae bacterium]
MQPLLLTPSGKDYLWGGERLKTEYNKKINLTPLAETWECSTHPDGPSTVVVGKYAGKTLAEVLQDNPEYLGSKYETLKELPVLIKFIDAQSDLSVQVHPSDEYARIHENQNGKSEMWYVIDALPGSKLVHGFEHDVTKEILRKAIDDGRLQDYLHYVQVKKGDTFFMPSGTVHAIGAGTLIAEIQENSNVTYRVYDYDRVGKDGQKRPLHFDKAAEVLNMKRSGNVRQAPRMVHYYYGCSRELLVRCKYFETEKIVVTKGFSFSVLDSSFQVLLCLNGEGGLETETENRPLRFSKGSCVFIPANMGRCHVIGQCELLKVRC